MQYIKISWYGWFTEMEWITWAHLFRYVTSKISHFIEHDVKAAVAVQKIGQQGSHQTWIHRWAVCMNDTPVWEVCQIKHDKGAKSMPANEKTETI